MAIQRRFVTWNFGKTMHNSQSCILMIHNDPSLCPNDVRLVIFCHMSIDNKLFICGSSITMRVSEKTYN